MLRPGPVPTEFQARAGIENRPSVLDRPAEAVAQAGYRGLMRGRRLVVLGRLGVTESGKDQIVVLTAKVAP